MKLEMKKFGRILSSRPAGREAFLASRAYVLNLQDQKEYIELDFTGITALGPSWADEFYQGLKEHFSNPIKVISGGNASVIHVFEFLNFPIELIK